MFSAPRRGWEVGSEAREEGGDMGSPPFFLPQEGEGAVMTGA